MKYIIVGAGPAGLMTAYKLKEKGNEVIIIEKGEKVGRKIYITGKGRCNVTNNCSKEDFFNNVVTNSKFLFSAYNNFTAQDVMEFFYNQNVELVTERGNRVFPQSYKAGDIAQALYEANKSLGVTIKLNETVLKITKQSDLFAVLTSKNTYTADKVVIATGGLSYPHTGSTGDGYKFASEFGHTIVPQVPALCALKVKENIPENLFRFTLKNVTLRVNYGKQKFEEFGEITFYKEGVAGATALSVSSLINRLPQDELNLEIDLKPALNDDKLDARLLREIADQKNKSITDILHKLLPAEMIDWFMKISKISAELPLFSLKKEDRLNILHSLKHFKLTYDGLDDIERATVTAGGVSVKEINPKTLESKIISGLYFAGEVIDVDAYTGGFNLQVAFSTGALIGKD